MGLVWVVYRQILAAHSGILETLVINFYKPPEVVCYVVELD
jgi:hypothetical protein